MKFPDKKYNIIYADPAWKYSSDPNSKRGIWGLANQHYKTMTIKDICDLPVSKIADKNCMLFLWVTFPNLQNGLDVVKAWGFEYKTTAFVWIKNNKTTIKPKKYGLGWYTRSNAEIVLLGKKGKFVRKSASVQQIITTSIQKHSKKPNEVRNRILQLCGDLPRIELFARQKIPKWDHWGNDDKLQNEPLEAYL